MLIALAALRQTVGFTFSLSEAFPQTLKLTKEGFRSGPAGLKIPEMYKRLLPPLGIMW